ncbi:DUF4158 domain-containing protein [Nonomuraea sp. NPDC046570]|uniref:DUF4158 domain-containing protein n=1 Tax=Nonomuraea sp. NPDC046570 TaxID=3155255 RepID=UPI00340332E0
MRQRGGLQVEAAVGSLLALDRHRYPVGGDHQRPPCRTDVAAVQRAGGVGLAPGGEITTVRYKGLFLEDPLDVPWVVVDHLAEQLKIADPSCVKAYIQRQMTAYEHAWEIRDTYGFHTFEDLAARLSGHVARPGRRLPRNCALATTPPSSMTSPRSSSASTPTWLPQSPRPASDASATRAATSSRTPPHRSCGRRTS